MGTLRRLRLVAEEEANLRKLEDDVGHKKWGAVWKKFLFVRLLDEDCIRLSEKKLKKIHSKFLSIMRLLKESAAGRAIEEDIQNPLQKEKFKSIVQYYFVQSYRFIRTYERVFRHFLKKERILAGKAKRIYNEIEPTSQST